MTTTDKSTTSAPTTTVSKRDHLPCVQYGFPKDEGPARTPKLCPLFEPIPEEATTASPIYILTREQYERQQRLESGYEVKGVRSIAKELQDECEADDRVLYPVHIESDVYHEEGPATLIEWFREFVEDYLNVPFHTCTLYFSGRRSIHVHVPRFVSGEGQRGRLKEQAETFCEETGAELDCALYDPKRLFRLPGVEHAKTELRKAEIEPEWEHVRIIREVVTSKAGVPESYETVLRRVFLKPSLMKDTAPPAAYTPLDLFRVLDSEKTVLEFESDGPAIDTPLIERKTLPDRAKLSEKKRWWTYNDKEFSPYALASGNGRSVAVVQVKGTPFARRDVTIGNSSRPVHALIPAYFYGARGCAGEEFTKDHQHAPLQLSKPDYEKWDYEEGDHVVIIGGKSNRSRIFHVKRWDAEVLGHALTGEDASREAALDYLESEGYDTGKAGTSGKAAPSPTTETRGGAGRKPCRYTSTILPVRNPTTAAARLQQRAEQDGIGTLTHDERWRLACRLLKWGWEPAWDWFKRQFGSDFKPRLTWEQFNSVIKSFPGDYDHVEVPPKPR